jgi:hypothetical protein
LAPLQRARPCPPRPCPPPRSAPRQLVHSRYRCRRLLRLPRAIVYPQPDPLSRRAAAAPVGGGSKHTQLPHAELAAQAAAAAGSDAAGARVLRGAEPKGRGAPRPHWSAAGGTWTHEPPLYSNEPATVADWWLGPVRPLSKPVLGRTAASAPVTSTAAQPTRSKWGNACMLPAGWMEPGLLSSLD